MGRIHRALDRSTGALVAIKTVRAGSAAERRRIEGEIRLMTQVRHEGIVRLLETGISGDEIFLCLELCEGTPLDRLLELGLPDAERICWLVGVAAKVAEALEHIHSCGIIHRDVKPSNILIVSSAARARAEAAFDDANPAVKLIDFGLALSTSAPAVQTAAGTPLYMPPEQICGAAEERSDLYSLGAVLYHLLAGSPPFTSLAAILSRANPPPSASPTRGRRTSRFGRP